MHGSLGTVASAQVKLGSAAQAGSKMISLFLSFLRACALLPV